MARELIKESLTPDFSETLCSLSRELVPRCHPSLKHLPNSIGEIHWQLMTIILANKPSRLHGKPCTMTRCTMDCTAYLTSGGQTSIYLSVLYEAYWLQGTLYESFNSPQPRILHLNHCNLHPSHHSTSRP